jgi:hypothetical protein
VVWSKFPNDGDTVIKSILHLCMIVTFSTLTPYCSRSSTNLFPLQLIILSYLSLCPLPARAVTQFRVHFLEIRVSEATNEPKYLQDVRKVWNQSEF